MKEMKGFEKGFSPSRSTGSGDNNENDIPKFQSHKKMVAKNFMSPTISAASKAASPRKKILAERNENLSNSDAENQKMSNPEMRKSPRNSIVSYSSRSPSWIVSLDNHVSDDDWDTNVVDKSLQDYDPLTNYLSPRPKYLRFNPNRRREIFDRLGKEGREELNSSLDSEEFNDGGESLEEEMKDSSFSPQKECVVEEHNEENTEKDDDYDGEEEEEEEEELEEERGGWCLRGVLKLLFTLIACLLSTSYICSMNSPTPSPTQQAISSLKDSYIMVKKQALEVINMSMYDAGFLEVEVGDRFGEVEEVEIDEDDKREMEESVDAKLETGDSLGEVEEVKIDEDDNGRAEERVEAEVEMGDSFGEVKEVEIDEDDNGGTEESSESTVVEDDAEYSEGRENFVGNEKEESEDKVDDEVAEIEVVRGEELEFKAGNFEQIVVAPARTDESDSSHVEEEMEEMESSYPIRNELEGSNQLQELELSVKSMPKEETPQQSKGVDETEPVVEVDEVDEIGYGNEVEMEKVGWNNTIAILGVSVVTVVLTSLAIVYRSKSARNISAQLTQESEKQEFAVKEERAVAQVLPPVKRKIEFFARPPVYHAIEEASREFSHHIHAPNVELIGEIVVGQRSSRTFRMTVSEVENTTFSTPIQPSQLEYSNTNSSSYGGLTIETKIMKKEGGQSGGAMVGVTPVRRSSRLRNRAAAMSP